MDEVDEAELNDSDMVCIQMDKLDEEEDAEEIRLCYADALQEPHGDVMSHAIEL